MANAESPVQSTAKSGRLRLTLDSKMFNATIATLEIDENFSNPKSSLESAMLILVSIYGTLVSGGSLAFVHKWLKINYYIKAILTTMTSINFLGFICQGTGSILYSLNSLPTLTDVG